MRNALIVAVALAAAGCGGREACDGNALQVVEARAGEEYRYVYLGCDGVTVRLECAKATGADVACVGDHTPECC